MSENKLQKKVPEIIVAADFSSLKELEEFLERFTEPIYLKVGMELFYALGPGLVEMLKKQGHHIFLDLKLHDIPNTVNKAAANISKLGADMINVHAAGGIEMMKAAKKAASESDSNPLVLAVTQLTSTSKEAMNKEQGIEGEVIDSVLRYAKNAKEAGLDGVVCSVWEVPAIKEACGKEFITVTPGIRLADDSVDDQKRVATPAKAKEQGSDYLVIGRSITKADNPQKTYLEIQAQLEN